jgi:hyperosmotically inducible protein
MAHYRTGGQNMTRFLARRSSLSFMTASLLLSGVMGVLGAPLPQTSQHTAPDNTRANKGDADKGATTADQQKMNPADRELARKIRASITDDKALSTYAHNVKIIAQDGKVTLKGPVRTEKEKADIEAKAAAVAGAGNVTNEIEVAPPKS